MDFDVSVIMPVHNAKRFIDDTLKSLDRQTYQNYELIMIENNSDDGSYEHICEIAKNRENTTVLRINETGAAPARNAGINAAKGRFIAFMDADDRWDNTKLERQRNFMLEKDIAFSYGGYRLGDENCNPTGKDVEVPDVIDYKHALRNTTIFTSTVMVDTTKIEKPNIVFPKIESEDTALWWNLLKLTNAYSFGGVYVTYRISGKSLSSSKIKAVKRIWNLYRNNERFGVIKSSFLFVIWAINAVIRRSGSQRKAE